MLWNPVQEQYYWPSGATRGDTVADWGAALETYGYRSCRSPDHEEGWEKVAIFSKVHTPTHVARQLPGGRWTSKIGKWEDIEHDFAALEGDRYGKISRILKRPVSDL